MTIHGSDPFATPEPLRSPVRRLRGRLPSAVTLWTAVDASGVPAGLTVSSTLVVDADPGRLLGLLDEESDVWPAIAASQRFAVIPLLAGDRQLADRFAGLLPAPGGLFAGAEWIDRGYGPVPAGHPTWAGCRLDRSGELGWGLLVQAVIERVELGDVETPLLYHRGRYHDGPR